MALCAYGRICGAFAENGSSVAFELEGRQQVLMAINVGRSRLLYGNVACAHASDRMRGGVQLQLR
jgi:hypothetical protein